MLRVGTREYLEGRCAFCGLRCAAGIAHDGGKYSQQGAKAMRRGAVVEGVAGEFGQRGLGALGRRHGIPGGLRELEITKVPY